VQENLAKQKLRIAIIGLGKMGLLHASLLNVIPDVELVALCDKSKLMNRLFKSVFKGTEIGIVNDLSKLSDLSPDAVYVTTPISSHSSIIKSLYAAKITRNIFVEKTLALNYIQAKELCQIAKDLDSITMVGYMKRFNVVFEKAKELLTNGNLGELISFTAHAYSSDFLGVTKESKSSFSRGGAVRDLGCHVIDLAFWLFGDLEMHEVTSLEKAETESETSIAFTAATQAGLSGQFEISQRKPNYRMPEFGLTIECQKGKIQVNDDRLLLTSGNVAVKKWFRHDLHDNVYFSMGEAEYFRENQQFVNALLTKQKCEPNFETAAKVDKFIDQVQNRCTSH
jgi:predicted dehydrogenase